MRTFEEALDDIYDRAKARQIAERRRNKRLITLATTCATLSVVVVLSVVFVWRPWSDGITSSGDKIVVQDTDGITETPTQPNVPTLPKFYYLSAMGEFFDDIWKIENGFALVDDSKFTGKSEIVVSSDKKNTTKTVDGLGVFTYKESEVVRRPSGNHDIYRVYDTYVSTDGNKSVTFIEGTDTMAYYNDNNKLESGEKIDAQQARKIAEDFIAKYLDGYSIEGMHTSISDSFFVGYGRKINSMITEETILIWVNEYGQIRGYNGRNIGKYDNIESSVTNEKISAAKKLLEDTLNKMELDYTVNVKNYVNSDCDGNVYLLVNVEVNTDNGVVSQDIYVPV